MPVPQGRTHARTARVLASCVRASRARSSRCRPLQRAVERGPAGQHLGADRRDHRDGGDNDQTGNECVLEHFATLLIPHQLVHKLLHNHVSLRRPTTTHQLVPATCRSADRTVIACTTYTRATLGGCAALSSERATLGFTPAVAEFCEMPVYRSGEEMPLIRRASGVSMLKTDVNL